MVSELDSGKRAGMSTAESDRLKGTGTREPGAEAGERDLPISLTLDDLVGEFNPFEIAAVNQCSGNSRDFFSPRVPGGQWANGAMGNALFHT
jgi:hypothetical protein